MTVNITISKYLFTALFSVALFTATAQTVKNDDIIIGRVDSVYSKTLKETRKLWVSLPPGATDTSNGKKQYPVAYLLDGDSHFASFASMLQRLNNSGKCPEMIVIGILNTDRLRDFTPTNSLILDDGSKADFLKSSGGGDQFIAFMKNELIPHIDSIYPSNSYKMLVGHSLGGLIAVDVLLNHQQLFNAYCVIDPSMWWDNRKLLKQSQQQLKANNYQNVALYLGIANTFSPDMDAATAQKDRTGVTEHYRSIKTLDAVIKKNSANGLIYKSRYYKDDDHGAVPLITEYDALHFLFSYYPLSRLERIKLQNKSADIDRSAVLIKHFKQMSSRMGYNIYPPESDLRDIGRDDLENKHLANAYSAFSVNLSNHPESQLANASMGDYYNTKKDYAKASFFYKKALQIKEDQDICKKLDALTAVAKK